VGGQSNTRAAATQALTEEQQVPHAVAHPFWTSLPLPGYSICKLLAHAKSKFRRKRTQIAFGFKGVASFLKGNTRLVPVSSQQTQAHSSLVF